MDSNLASAIHQLRIAGQPQWHIYFPEPAVNQATSGASLSHWHLAHPMTIYP
jgi:hypothetical protein